MPPVVLQAALTRIVDTVDISAVEAGVLADVMVREGQVVEQGAKLAQVDDGVARLALETARIESSMASEEAGNDVLVRVAVKTHELAKTDLSRAMDLNRKLPDSIPQREIDALRLAMEKAALETEEARHRLRIARFQQELRAAEVEIAQVQLERLSVRAPTAGLIVHVEKRAGEWVKAGDLIARIVRIDRVRVEGYVTATQAAYGLQDRRVTLQAQGPGEQSLELSGRVVFVSPEANPVDRRVRIWADFDNPDFALRPGLPVQARVLPDKIAAD